MEETIVFFNFWKWKLEYWSQLDFEIQAKKNIKIQTDLKLILKFKFSILLYPQ